MTKAQELGITEFPYVEFDDNGKLVYFEDSNGYWEKREYDQNDIQIYYEDSSGYWVKYEYDHSGNTIYSESSDGDWSWRRE